MKKRINHKRFKDVIEERLLKRYDSNYPEEQLDQALDDACNMGIESQIAINLGHTSYN